MTKRIRSRLARLERLPTAEMSLKQADQRTVDIGTVVVENPLLPFAEVRGADPDRVVDPGVDQALRSVIDETVLARPHAEALAEQQDLRPHARAGHCAQPLADRAGTNIRDVPPSLLDAVERER